MPIALHYEAWHEYQRSEKIFGDCTRIMPERLSAIANYARCSPPGCNIWTPACMVRILSLQESNACDARQCWRSLCLVKIVPVMLSIVCGFAWVWCREKWRIVFPLLKCRHQLSLMSQKTITWESQKPCLDTMGSQHHGWAVLLLKRLPPSACPKQCFESGACKGTCLGDCCDYTHFGVVLITIDIYLSIQPVWPIWQLPAAPVFPHMILDVRICCSISWATQLWHLKRCASHFHTISRFIGPLNCVLNMCVQTACMIGAVKVRKSVAVVCLQIHFAIDCFLFFQPWWLLAHGDKRKEALPIVLFRRATTKACYRAWWC